MTQEDRILQLLKKNEAVHPTTIVAQTGILQYNARINGLRKRFGCIHKNGNTVCLATEHVINKRKGRKTTLFIYKKTESPFDKYKKQDKKVLKIDQDTLF